MTAYESVLNAARQLPDDERMNLVRELMRSLTSQRWMTEARKRLDAYDRGQMVAVDVRDVLGEIDALLAEGPRRGSDA
jgi:hypothetical protein